MKSLRYGLIAIAAAATFAPLGSANAYTYKVLYNFCSQANCADGAAPYNMLMDSAGNFYGLNSRNIFELVNNGGIYSYQSLYNFCTAQRCVEAYSPLITDTKGNLYGVFYDTIPSTGTGQAFELVREKKGAGWTLRVLYNFCSLASCADGKNPASVLTYAGATSGAPYDGRSPLYGVTNYGGPAGNNEGVAYRLSGSKHDNYDVIYDFCQQVNCADGLYPDAVLADASGNIFGTAHGDFDTLIGSVFFELSPSGKTFTQTVLHQFVFTPDGWGPQVDGFTLGADGNFRGQTGSGGSCSGADGTIYEVEPNGVNSQENVLYSSCSDPSRPLLDASNNVFWATYYGGTYADGEIIENRTDIYDFCQQANCADGANPFTGLMSDASGNLYGTTTGGGANNGGVLFELSP